MENHLPMNKQTVQCFKKIKNNIVKNLKIDRLLKNQDSKKNNMLLNWKNKSNF